MPETTKPRRKPRRNFAEERARVVQYCKLAIQVYGPIANAETEAATERASGLTAQGRTDAYREILRQMGESE